MTDTIPDHVGREAVRLLNETYGKGYYQWPRDCSNANTVIIAKLLMNPPAPMTDPDEEAAKRVIAAYWNVKLTENERFAAATEQMRKEREAWEAGR